MRVLRKTRTNFPIQCDHSFQTIILNALHFIAHIISSKITSGNIQRWMSCALGHKSRYPTATSFVTDIFTDGIVGVAVEPIAMRYVFALRGGRRQNGNTEQYQQYLHCLPNMISAVNCVALYTVLPITFNQLLIKISYS